MIKLGAKRNCGGRFYKVLTVRSRGDNSYTFECRDIDSKESRVLKYRLSGLLEVLDRAVSIMKSPRDIFLLDLDNDGQWKIVTEAQIGKFKA